MPSVQDKKRKQVELTGDFNADMDIIGDAYKPDDIDTPTWRSLYRSIAGQESGGDVNTGESRFGRLPKGKRAFGVMQVLPSTAVEMGFTEDEIKSDPAMNFAAGVKYLRNNWDRFGKNKRVLNPEHRLATTIASYHAGYGAVEKDLDKNGDGVPDIDDGAINTRDYTGNILDRILASVKNFTPQSDLESSLPELTEMSAQDIARAEEAGLPGGKPVTLDEIRREGALAAPVDVMAPLAAQVEAQRRKTVADLPERKSFEEELVQSDRRTREVLGLIVPDTHPHKGIDQKVYMDFVPGQPITEDNLIDAVTTALTGDRLLGDKFRRAVGENPGGPMGFQVTNDWLKKQIESGNLTYVPANPQNPQAGGWLEGDVPVQNYIRNRLQAFSEGGVEGVKRKTLEMRKEIDETARLVAETEYGKVIDAWKQAEQDAIKRGDAEGRREAAANWIRLQAELDIRYPHTYLGEAWRGFKAGLARGNYNILRTGANLRDIAQAPFLNEQEIKEADARDKRVRNLERALEKETPDARNFAGQLAEAATSELVYTPVYILGGLTLGPAGGIMTTAVRSANKPLDEAMEDIAASMFELVGGSLLKGRYVAGRGLSARRELLAEMAAGGLTEAGGDALIEVMKGKVPDWKDAIKNLIIGAGMEGGLGLRGALRRDRARRPEGEGEVPFDVAEPRQFDTEVRSPLMMTMGKDGNPRFAAVIRQGSSIGLVEIPPNHPIILKHQQGVEAGAASLVAVRPEEFDDAFTQWGGNASAINLPVMSRAELIQYLQDKSATPGKPFTDEDIVIGVQPDESEIEGRRLPGEVGVGKEPVKTGVVERRRRQAAETGGVLQERGEIQEETETAQRLTKPKTKAQRVAEAVRRFEAEPPVIRRRGEEREDEEGAAEIEEEGLPSEPGARARVLEARRRFEAAPPVIKRGEEEVVQPADVEVASPAAARAREARAKFEAEPPAIVRGGVITQPEPVVKPKVEVEPDARQKRQEKAVRQPEPDVEEEKIGKQKQVEVEVEEEAQPLQPTRVLKPQPAAAPAPAAPVRAAAGPAPELPVAGKKQKRAFKGAEFELDADFTEEFDSLEAEYRKDLASAKGDKSRLAKIGRQFGIDRRELIEKQRERDAEARVSEAEAETQAKLTEREKALSDDERAVLESAYNRLGVRDDEGIRNLLYQANRRYVKKIQGTAEGAFAAAADEKRNSLTKEEVAVLGKVISANFTAPIKKPTVPGVTSDYGRAVQGMTEAEFAADPQLVANYNNLENFFDALSKGQVPPADVIEVGQRLLAEDELTEEESAEKYEKEQKEIVQGTKKVRRGSGLEVILPRRLAAQWELADNIFLDRQRTIQNAVKNGTMAAKEADAGLNQAKRERQSVRKRIFNEYDALEAEQFNRGYEKGTGRPLIIVEDKGTTMVVHYLGDEVGKTVELRGDEVETRGERSITRRFEPKLPFGIRMRMNFNRFSEASPRAVAKDGAIYMNNAMQNRIEEAIAPFSEKVKPGELTFFTFDKQDVPTLIEIMNDAGLSNIAQMLKDGNISLINVNNDFNPGLANVHERIHRVAQDFELPETAYRWLEEQGNVQKFLDEVEIPMAKQLAQDAYGVTQEILAYGLTGDFDSLGVTPDTLYNAALDVIQAYLNAFPNKDVEAIGANALVNFNDIRSEAERRVRKANEDIQAKAGEASIRGRGEAASAAEARGGVEAASVAVASGVEPARGEAKAAPRRVIKVANQGEIILEPAEFITQTMDGMNDAELVTRLETGNIEIPEEATREVLEELVEKQVEKDIGNVIPQEYTEPAFITEARKKAPEAKKEKGRPANLAETALTLGWQSYQAGDNFQQMTDKLTVELGEAVTPLLNDLWNQFTSINDWLNGSRSIGGFLLSRLSPGAKANEVLPLIRKDKSGHSKAGNAGVKADDVAWSRLEEYATANPDATVADIIKELINSAPKLIVTKVKSASGELGATSTTRSETLTLAGKAKNQRHFIFKWDNAPSDVRFKTPEHFGRTENVVFDVRVDDRVTDRNENALNFIEAQSDIHQTRKGDKKYVEAPLKATWLQKAVEFVVNEARLGGYDGIIIPKTAQQVAEIQRWGRIEEEDGKYFIYSGTTRQDVSAVVKKYLQEFPKLFQKVTGQKIETRNIDAGAGETNEVSYIPTKNMDVSFRRLGFQKALTKEQRESLQRLGKRRNYRTIGFARDVVGRNETKTELPVDRELEKVARQYSKIAGLKPYSVGNYYNYNPEQYVQLADLMEILPHDSHNVDVIKAYDAFNNESVDQYLFLLSRGLKPEPWLQPGQPYANSAGMRQDVRENNHLYFFLGGGVPADHPLAQQSGLSIGEYPMTYLDIFRVIHDYFGHAVSGAQFGARGEWNATDSHARLYSYDALPAMLGETVFQNAWVNAGKHIRRSADDSIPKKGDNDFIDPAERPYAEQKAINITPEHIDIWLAGYDETPIEFLKAREAQKATETVKEKAARVYQDALRKPEEDLGKADVKATVEAGRFALFSGNIDVNSASAEGKKRTKRLAAELRKMGYKVLEAEGVYAPEGKVPTIEPSVFVLLEDKYDVANILRIGAKYKQAQVLIGEDGKYRAPFTNDVDYGKRGQETRGRQPAVFGKDAEAQVGKSIVKTANGDITFSTPDVFAKTYKQGKAERELVAELEAAYQRSFDYKAKKNSGDLLDWLQRRVASGKREQMSIITTAQFLSDATAQMFGEVPDRTFDGLSEAEFDSVRARRARTDLIKTIKHFQKGRGDSESGRSWYAAAIAKMLAKTGQAFPEITTIPQLTALFEVVLAVSSSGMDVQANYDAATKIWKRAVEQFKLGYEDAWNNDILPVRQEDIPENYSEEGYLKPYGRFDPQLEKLNNLSRGLIPVTPAQAREMEAAGKKIIKTVYFPEISGATQNYVADPALEEMIDRLGRIGGVMEYLLQPGSNKTHPYRATEILGPKIGAFFLNIAGFSQLVTVDTWASRWFYRLNGGLLNATTPTGIQDSPKSGRDGNLIRGIMQSVSEEWNATHENKLSPADVQAILWYAEKDIWFSAGAEDSGQINFFDAAERTINEEWNNFEGTADVRQRAVADWVAGAPAMGARGRIMHTEEAEKENQNFFVRQMSVAGRLGLAATSRRQLLNQKLLAFDSASWMYEAERMKGSPLEAYQTNEMYRLLNIGYRARTKDEKEDAIQNLRDYIGTFSEQGMAEFILTVRRAGFLSGIKTFSRNTLGNLAAQVMNEVSRGVSAPIDTILAAYSKEPRTVQGISPKGILHAAGKGFTEGWAAFKKTLVKGVPGASYENFNLGYDPKSGYKWLDATLGNYAKYVFRLQGAADAMFRTYGYHRALYAIADLEQKSGGRLIQDTLTAPTVEQSDLAYRVAEVLVFQNDNPINTAYQRGKSKLKQSTIGKPIGFLLDYEVPFVKTGSNIFLATMEYLGVQALLGASVAAGRGVKAVTKGEWQQYKQEMWDAIQTEEVRRTIAELAGKGLTGLAVATIGYFLAAAGYLEGIEEEDEEKRRKREAKGAGAGHIKIGDRWYDIRQLSPVGTILLSGASVFGALQKDTKDPFVKVEQLMKFATSLVINGIPPARTAEEFANPRATNLFQRVLSVDSVVPSFVNEIAQSMDSFQRERNAETVPGKILKSVQAKIPGLREKLPVKEDVLGRPIQQPFGQDPFASKRDVSTSATREAAEVDLNLTLPKQREKDGKKEPLEEFRVRREKTLDLIKRVVDASIENPDYPKSASKEDRKEVLKSGISYARKMVRKDEDVSDRELQAIVKSVLRGRKKIEEIEANPRMSPEVKKRAKQSVSQATGMRIKAATGDKDE